MFHSLNKPKEPTWLESESRRKQGSMRLVGVNSDHISLSFLEHIEILCFVSHENRRGSLALTFY